MRIEKQPLVMYKTPKLTVVGAGPGEVDLITLKAIKVLKTADVVLYDALVNEELLDFINPNAEIIFVGKRRGCYTYQQEQINNLIVSRAETHGHVVRLKGGDPFIFGRGGEEVQALQAAGIAVTAVNGITSGLAALSSLNVSLTHRDHAQGVVFVTGHAKPGTQGTDWAALSTTAYQAKLTLVIYMGVTHASDIQTALLQGLPVHTPVALIHNATLPTQRHAVCTLGELTHTMRAQRIASPAIMVVGDVVQGLLATGACLQQQRQAAWPA